MTSSHAETEPHTDTAVVPLVIALFGPIRVLVNGRPLPHLRSRKATWLLALLVLRAGRPVEREWLAGTLWPDSHQEQAFDNMRPVLSELRRALGTQKERLQSPNRHTLCLEMTGADVDVAAFDAAIASKKLPALERAVALYTGPLLEGCPEEWASQERTVREQDCLRALQTLGEAALESGDYGTASDYFQRAVALDPWRDAVRRGLMEALSKTGDTNGALKVYRDFTDLLRTDPNAVPDPETSALYSRLRAEARRPAAIPALAVTRAVPAPVVSGYLPHALTDLVGREDERLEVGAKLRRSRLVTLTGPGGIGKTRLAIEVAREVVREYADGVWLVALDSLSDGKLIVPQIASVLGLKEDPGRTFLETLTDHLRTKHLLLVLDNCEHIIETMAQVAGYLLQECSGLRILTTSREALGITGETVWAVPALAVPDLAHLLDAKTMLARVLGGFESVQLFTERAQAVQKSFALTVENALAVAQVCARLEGIPLAIELAAARVNVLTVEQIAGRLDDYLSLLSGSHRGGPSRQQTLRATLDWSYALLSEPERLLLGRLSVFIGGWTLEAAERVCAGEEQVHDLLAGLVDKSLVMFDQGAVGGRYRFLEAVRQYAAEQLDVRHETDIVKARHSAWAAAFVEEIEPELSGATLEKWLKWLNVEYDNMRAALDFCQADFQEAETGLRIASVLRQFWYSRGRSNEGRDYLRRALERHNPALRTAVRAKALLALGILSYILSEHEAANALAEESLSIYRALGDRRGIAACLFRQGAVEFERGNLAAAQTLHEESLSIKRELGDVAGIGGSVFSLGMIYHMRGDFTSAGKLFEESMTIDRIRGDISGLAWSCYQLAMTRHSQGALPEAKALLEEGLSIFRELEDRRGIAFSVLYLGDLAVEEGDFTASRNYFEESLSVAHELNEKRSIAWAVYNLGRSLVLLGDDASAKPLIDEGLSRFHEMKDRRGIAMVIRLQGRVAYNLGDYPSAQRLLQQSLKNFMEVGDMTNIPSTLAALVSAMFAQGAVADAVRLCGAMDAHHEKNGPSMSEVDFEEWKRQMAEARSVLGEEAFAAAWEEGRALTWEQAVAYALGE